MKIIFITLILTLLQTSCYVDNQLESDNNYGNLKVIVNGKNGKPTANAIIWISGEGKQIDNKSTDSNGEFKTSLIEGNYLITTKVFDENVYYTDNRYIQIIGGLSKVCTYNPCNNIGEVKLQITRDNNTPLSFYKLALLTKESTYGTRYSIGESKSITFSTATSDSMGIATFKDTPKDFRFTIAVHYKDTILVSTGITVNSQEFDSDYIYKFHWSY